MSNIGLIGFPQTKLQGTSTSILSSDLPNFTIPSAVDAYRSYDRYAPGFLGVFGNGMVEVFIVTGHFLVPNFVDTVRIRVIGAGGGGAFGGTGGAGGGYAHGIFNVTPGSLVPVTIGAGGTQGTNANGGAGGAGGTSSFGSLISATGGGGGIVGTASSPAPGQGIGGEVQTRGGTSTGNTGGGGGGAGSQFGKGGTAYSTGGAGIGRDSYTALSSGFFGTARSYATAASASANNPQGYIIRFPFDGFGFKTGELGDIDGNGGAAASIGEIGGVGGGGGGGTTAQGGMGGFGGGGGGCKTAGYGGFGGTGLVIVEY